MSVPFHKQTDPNKQAGQIVKPIPEQYLHQYIERKTEGPTRITFVEWAKQHEVNGVPLSLHALSDNEWQLMETIWNAALTKGKL